MKQSRKGFTLVELLVVVLIIGVLAAIALPMYQKAVLKSRFTALMPIGKSMADSNEAYYLEHGRYADNVQDLPVQGQSDYDDGTSVDLVSNDDYVYTLVYNEDNLPNHNYLAFQKHSPKFAGTTMCEARDATAAEVCIALGGTDLGGGVTPDWTAYLLSGDATGSNFCPTGATCDESGNITECPSGKTPKAGKCTACDIENATACSTTSYAATSCASGYCMKNGACVTCDYAGNASCTSQTHCENSTFGDNAYCGFTGYCDYSSFNDQSTCKGNNSSNRAYCRGATFGGESSCGQYALCGMFIGGPRSTFTENATCSGDCTGAAFSGNASCTGGICSETSTFTDNASCVGDARCYGAVFSGNSVCTSSWPGDVYGGGCSRNRNNERSTFTGNAVCAGIGCNTATYEQDACCAGDYCGNGKIPKCTASVVNGQTVYTHTGTYWDGTAIP